AQKHAVTVTLQTTDNVTVYWSQTFVLPDTGQQRITVRSVSQAGGQVLIQLLQDGQVLATSAAIATANNNLIRYKIQHTNPGDNGPNPDPTTFTYDRRPADSVAFLFDAGQFSEA